MAVMSFITAVHTQTKRNYLARVLKDDKAACAEVAVQYGRDYWDGERKYGYGGFRYDGRWLGIAQKIAAHYQLKPGDKILDVGCGKGFLLYEFTRAVPGVQVAGLDISAYALENAKPEVRPFLTQGNAVELPYPKGSFDLVVSITTLHNLYNYDLRRALREIERVGKRNKYIAVEAYRNEREKANLLYWQLTCRAFHTPEEWLWLMRESGYQGDAEFIFFE